MPEQHLITYGQNADFYSLSVARICSRKHRILAEIAPQIMSTSFDSYIVPYNNCLRQSRGVALLMSVFVIAFGTLIVFELGKQSWLDAAISRGFTESIQADFVARSGVNLGRVILEIPEDPQSVGIDSLMEPWSLIGRAQSLPIPGLVGEPRLMIVDERSKIEVNDIVSDLGAFQEGKQNANIVWLEALHYIFSAAGFASEQFEPGSYITPGDAAFPPDTQAATVFDWIDRDTESFSDPNFPAQGTESSLEKDMFYNRKLLSLTELLKVPGITPLRLRQIAKFTRISSLQSGHSPGINVNTASPEILRSIGLSETLVAEIVDQRANSPWTQQALNNLLTLEKETKMQGLLDVNSKEYSIVVRIAMPNQTKWIRAQVLRNGSGLNYTTAITRIETL